MWHHAHHVSFAIQNACDSASRSVRIFEIAKSDAILSFELIQRALIGKILPFAVRDRQAKNLTLLQFRSERGIAGFGPEWKLAADEFEFAVAQERARQQTGFNQ